MPIAEVGADWELLRPDELADKVLDDDRSDNKGMELPNRDEVKALIMEAIKRDHAQLLVAFESLKLDRDYPQVPGQFNGAVYNCQQYIWLLDRTFWKV